MSNPAENVLIDSGKPLIFRVTNPENVGLLPPENRLGNAVRSSVRSLTVFQKEALVVSSRTGLGWRFASDEGPYLMGHDVAPAPLAYLTTGMVSSYMSEILALAKSRNIAIQNIRLVQDNFYTMNGSMLQGTMTAGAKDV
ncbi:MAG: OsmC family protein, partial [Desulfobulbia bacterium]